MVDIESASNAIFLGAILFGIVAVVVGVGGLFVVLTGDSPDRASSADVLGEFACEEDRDVPFPGETDYGVTATSSSADGIASVENSTEGAGYVLNVTMEDTILNSLTWSFENEPGPEFTEDGNTVSVRADEREPFRLFIDTVTEDGDVIRHELDICPPSA